MQLKNISRLAIAALLATAFFRPSAASAQRLESPYQFITQKQHIDAFGVYFDPSHGRLGAGPNSGYGAGIRWGIAISAPLALDLEVSYAALTRPVVDTAFNADSSHVVKGQADMNM